MNFGDALEVLKKGGRVQRKGWNGKGMWLAMSPGVKENPADKFWSPAVRGYAKKRELEVIPVDPYIVMYTAQAHIVPWLASQADMLGEDWQWESVGNSGDSIAGLAEPPGLTFKELRNANLARLPGFKNSKGEDAHPTPWTPAQWLQAMVGEVGEYANFRKKYERGDISWAQFIIEANKELADVQIYLDLLASDLGVNLGEATRAKFNEVSKRVGSDVKL